MERDGTPYRKVELSFVASLPQRLRPTCPLVTTAALTATEVKLPPYKGD